MPTATLQAPTEFPCSLIFHSYMLHALPAAHTSALHKATTFLAPKHSKPEVPGLDFSRACPHHNRPILPFPLPLGPTLHVLPGLAASLNHKAD